MFLQFIINGFITGTEEEQFRKLEELKVAVKGIISILEKREGRN